MIDDKIQEELRAKYNPDGSVLRQIQLGALDTLIEFDSVCKKNNIQYWLDSGTLLGAMRHGGFIPWDDDVDICVSRRDLRRLLKCLKRDLGGNFRLHNGRKDNYPDSVNHCLISRVLNKRVLVSRKKDIYGNSLYEPIWIDIFPLENGSLAIKKIVEKTYGKFLRRKTFMIQDGKFKHLLSVVLEFVSLPFIQLLRFYGRLFHGTTYIHDYGINFNSLRHKKDVFPLIEHSFEGVMFPCPGNADNYLSKLYGNWHLLPETGINHYFVAIKKQ